MMPLFQSRIFQRRAWRLVVGILAASAIVYGVLRRPARESEFRIREIVHEMHAPDLGYQDRPNILFILIDTLRADHLGAYGYSRPTSPAIDRIAAEDGVVFERAYSVAPWTNPTIATLFTGKYPQTVFAAAPHHIAIRTALPKNVATVAEVMKQAGYRTIALIDHPGINKRLGYDRGFDAFHVLFRESGTRHWQRTAPDFVLEAFDRATANVGESEEPVFLYLHLVYPHRPYVPESRYAEMFGSGFTEMEASQRDGMINMYDAEIRQTDALMGKIVANMLARGWYDETAVIFTSDHGEGFWEHGVQEHGSSFFDEEIRIPLIVVPPGGRTTEPARIERPVSNVGLFATVLDFAGVSAGSGVHGASMLRFFRADEETEADPEWFFSESPHSGNIHSAAVLSSRGDKYIREQVPELFPEEMLFDVIEDPAERENIAFDSPALESYRALLREHTEMNRIALAAADQDTVDVDPDTLERLRSLGYVP